MNITRAQTLLTTGVIGALIILLCLGGCGGGSDSTEQKAALLELAGLSQGYQAKPLDLRSADVRSAILDLLEQSGESAEESPKLYQRLSEELNEDGAELNGTAEADATIDQVGRISSGEVFVRSSLDLHEDHVYILFLHAFIDAEGNILGTPERQEFFAPEERLEISSSSYSSDLNDEVTALSIFAVENRSGNFSLYAASFNPPTMQGSSSAALSMRRIATGCLAAGTPVLRADGSVIPIENVTAGMKVMLNESGATGTVEATSSGTDPHPKIIIQMSGGASILASELHPFFTQSGLKSSKEIKAGDSLRTMHGVVKLTSVEKVANNGKTYNLSITRDPSVTYPSFVANGFVVGDMTTQNKLLHAPVKQSDDVILRRLPSEWHGDFLSSRGDSSQ